jgi:hypothetical protein
MGKEVQLFVSAAAAAIAGNATAHTFLSIALVYLTGIAVNYIYHRVGVNRVTLLNYAPLWRVLVCAAFFAAGLFAPPTWRAGVEVFVISAAAAIMEIVPYAQELAIDPRTHVLALFLYMLFTRERKNLQYVPEMPVSGSPIHDMEKAANHVTPLFLSGKLLGTANPVQGKALVTAKHCVQECAINKLISFTIRGRNGLTYPLRGYVIKADNADVAVIVDGPGGNVASCISLAGLVSTTPATRHVTAVHGVACFFDENAEPKGSYGTIFPPKGGAVMFAEDKQPLGTHTLSTLPGASGAFLVSGRRYYGLHVGAASGDRNVFVPAALVSALVDYALTAVKLESPLPTERVGYKVRQSREGLMVVDERRMSYPDVSIDTRVDEHTSLLENEDWTPGDDWADAYVEETALQKPVFRMRPGNRPTQPTTNGPKKTASQMTQTRADTTMRSASSQTPKTLSQSASTPQATVKTSSGHPSVATSGKSAKAKRSRKGRRAQQASQSQTQQ